MIIIKNSNLLKNEKKERVFLSCEHSEKYKGKKLNFNVKDTSEQWRSKSIGTKKCDCPFLELSVEEGWVLSITCGAHKHLASEHLEEYSFTGRLSEKEERLL